MGKQPVARKEYSEEYWLTELQEGVERITGRRDINWNNVENGVKHQSIN